MKKSSQVPATLIVALAGWSATGCGSGGYNECVDPTGNAVDDGFCRSGVTVGGYHYRHVSSGGFGGSSSSGGFFGG